MRKIEIIKTTYRAGSDISSGHPEAKCRSMITNTNITLELTLFRTIRGLVLVCLLGLVSSKLSAAVDITDLGTLGGEQSIAFAINDSDQVVGLSWTSDGPSHSFLYSDGQMTDLYPLNSQELITAGPTGINDLGQIATGAIGGDGMYYPVIYDTHSGLVTQLGSLGGVTSYGFSGVATAINNWSQAVGYSYLDEVNRHAFIYDHGVLQDIGCLPGESACSAYALAINDRGQVVGSSSRAFLYSRGTMTEINPFGSLASYARGINNQGSIVGEYLIADQTAFHAFLYRDGVFTDIGNSDSPETVAYDINDMGQVVGTTWVLRDNSCRDCNEYEPRAFFYENGVMTQLNSLLPPGSEWKLVQAFAINKNGDIAGYGVIQGRFHAFLLTWPRLKKVTNPAKNQNTLRTASNSTPSIDAARLPGGQRIQATLGERFLLDMRAGHRASVMAHP